MTEPYHSKDSQFHQLPANLQFILETLIDYKKSLQKILYKSQSPQMVNILMKKVDGAGLEFLELLNNSSYVANVHTYPELASVFTSLRQQIQRLSGRDKFILHRWIEQLFFQNPLTVDLNHIENLSNTWFEPEGYRPQETLTQEQNDLQDKEV